MWVTEHLYKNKHWYAGGFTSWVAALQLEAHKMIWALIKKWLLKGVLTGFDELKPAIAGIIKEEQKKSLAIDADAVAGAIVDHVKDWVFKKLKIQEDIRP